MSDAPKVRPGQVWADNDRRYEGRTLRVERIEGLQAVCIVLTNSTNHQARIDKGDAWAQDTRGKERHIALSRMKPTSTGYRLIQDRAR
jgi:hypothetical protein